MSIRGQGFRDIVTAHEHKADGVAQRVRFVGPLLQQCQSRAVKRFVNPLRLAGDSKRSDMKASVVVRGKPRT